MSATIHTTCKRISHRLDVSIWRINDHSGRRWWYVARDKAPRSSEVWLIGFGARRPDGKTIDYFYRRSELQRQHPDAVFLFKDTVPQAVELREHGVSTIYEVIFNNAPRTWGDHSQYYYAWSKTILSEHDEEVGNNEAGHPEAETGTPTEGNHQLPEIPHITAADAWL